MRYRVKGVDRLDDLMVSVEEEYVALALEKLLKEMRKMLKEVEFEPVNTAE